VLLRDARLIQVALIVVLFLLLYCLLRRLIPKSIAFFVILFASFDPYFLGMSRLLNHEAMLSLFVMISALALLVYFLQGRKFVFLLLSGITAGLAQLTKSSAVAILAPVGVTLLMQVIQPREGFAKAIWATAKTFLVWLVILAGTYVVFWPGMWVAPGKMLYEVYGNAFSYAFQGARLKVTENLDTSDFSLDANASAFGYLISVIVWRTTPLTWLGALLGLTLPFTRDRELVRPNRHLFTILLTTAAVFILIFGIARGRNSPHYLLACYLALNLLAGLGWFQAVKRLAGRFTPTYGEQAQYLILFLLFLGQAWNALSAYPYYYSYGNPLLQAAGWYADFPQKPYGEGLEYAAQYLADLPDAENSTALVYYARGCFSYFYPGETIRFKPYFVDDGHEAELMSAFASADYLVLYFANQGKMEKYAPLFDALSAVEPIHEIWMDGYKYATIYAVGAFPPTVFEVLQK
jgi:4-amino-4-deoxy-L-arabinose transferase-like glycosyltransferase